MASLSGGVGKSFVVEKVFSFFPSEAFHALSSTLANFAGW
jgi:hypothetical protein